MLKEKWAEKVECECGMTVSKRQIKRQTRQLHRDNMLKIESNTPDRGYPKKK